MRIPARSMLTALLLSALTLTMHGCGNDHTAPYREYHFIGMGGNITVLLAGTSENPDAAAEKCAKDIFFRALTKKFPNFAVHYSHSVNPVQYIIQK